MTVWGETLVEIPRLRFQITFFDPLVIKDWSVSAPNSHLVGGMKYHDGKLIVPITGRYNIYLHTYFHSTYGRIYVDVNGKSVTMTQTPGTTVHAAGFSAWKQVTSSPFQRLLTASFIWLSFILTLAHIWFKNLMSGNCAIILTINRINFCP